MSTTTDNSRSTDLLARNIRHFINFCKAESLSRQSIQIYQVSLDYFYWWCTHLGNVPLDPKEVTFEDIIEYVVYLKTPQEARWGLKVRRDKQKLSVASINTYMRGLKVFFNHLESKKTIVKSPIPRDYKVFSKKDPLPTKFQKNLAQEQITKIFTYLTDPENLSRYTGYRNLAIVSLLLDSGMRKGELLSIKLGDFDWENSRVFINGKSGPRTCFFSPSTEQALNFYFDDYRSKQRDYMHETDPFWFTSDDHPLTYEGITTFLKTVKQKTGVHFSAHSLRHTFASLMVEKVSIYDLSKLLGHSSVAITEGYTHNSVESMQRVFTNNSPLATYDYGQLKVKTRRGRPKGAKNLKRGEDEG
ncbi:MAG: site-specific integrase [Chloroflexi bacterium]|nr:site-specific integrase [Chloroflexota bacterium]OJW02662.1 MAG: hypothetical protein BGO39_33150 [Chloroflexi bacterium 54-19]